MKEIDDIKNLIKVLEESYAKVNDYAKTKKTYRKVGWGSFFHKGWIIDTLMFLTLVGASIGLCVSPLIPLSMIALSFVIVPVVGLVSLMASKAIRIIMQTKFEDSQKEESCVQKLLDIGNEMETASMLLEHKYKDLLNVKDGFTYRDLKEYRKCIEDIKYFCGDKLEELINSMPQVDKNKSGEEQKMWQEAKDVVCSQRNKIMVAACECKNGEAKYRNIDLTNLSEKKLCEKLPVFTTEKFSEKTKEPQKVYSKQYVQNNKEKTEEIDR